MTKKIILLNLLLIMKFFLSGCTYNVLPIDTAFPQKPLIEKLPISMGIYYNDALRSYEVLKEPYPHIYYRIALGSSSVTLFDQAFFEMFEKVIRVYGLPPLTQNEFDIKAVIKPIIDHLDIYTDRKMSWIEVELYYRVILYALNGANIANLFIKGSGFSGGAFKSIDDSAIVRKAAQIAMRDVAAQLMLGFRKNPEVMKWLEDIGVTAGY